MNSQTYLIKCVTNLHVGNGDVNFGVVDNEVQKDPVTGFPCIYSSSVKGALRDYFGEIECKDIEAIFGSDAKESNDNGGKGSIKGLLKFMQASVLFLPARAISGNQAYYMATCKQALEDFGKYYYMLSGKEIREGFKDLVSALDNEKNYVSENDMKMRVGVSSDNTAISTKLSEMLSEVFGIDKAKIVVIKDKDFAKITLPVMARNNLTVQNLFYEEVVPHESVFYFGVISTGSTEADAALTSFDSNMKDNLIQFGGNASIGYGLCEVSKLA